MEVIPKFVAKQWRRFVLRCTVMSMSSSGSGGTYYWCLRHNRVETDANACAAMHRLGPYATEAEAERALERVADRNAEWDAEDARWAGDDN